MSTNQALREAVIAELYKRHPSLGARSIDEFADFVAALAESGPGQALEGPYISEEVFVRGTITRIEHGAMQIRLHGTGFPRMTTVDAEVDHYGRTVLAAQPGQAASGAQPSNEQIAIIKLHAIAKHLNISDPPMPDNLLAAVALAERAAEWARLHIERRWRCKENDELREQAIKLAVPAKLTKEQVREALGMVQWTDFTIPTQRLNAMLAEQPGTTPLGYRRNWDTLTCVHCGASGFVTVAGIEHKPGCTRSQPAGTKGDGG